MESAASAVLAFGRKAYELHQKSGSYSVERMRLNTCVQQLVDLVRHGRQRLQPSDIAPLQHDLEQATRLMEVMARDERQSKFGLPFLSRPVGIIKKASYVDQCAELLLQLERRLATLSQVMQAKAALVHLYPRAEEATLELWREVRNPQPSESALRRYAADGADLNKLHGVVGTCLHHCASEDKANAIRALVELGADVNQRNKHYETGKMTGPTPLHVAARNGHISATYALLVECGADRSLRDADGNLPLDLAQHGKHKGPVTILTS